MKKSINHLKSKYFRRIQNEVDSSLLEERELYLRDQLQKYLSMVPQCDDKPIVRRGSHYIKFVEPVK